MTFKNETTYFSNYDITYKMVVIEPGMDHSMIYRAF